MTIHVDDNVVLKSTSRKELWKVIHVTSHTPLFVTIQGITNRLIKVILEERVEKVDNVTASSIIEQYKSNNMKALQVISKNIQPKQSIMVSGDNLLSKIPGTILHIDSAPNFLKECMNFYKGKNLIAHGYSMKPDEIPKQILQLLNTFNPDILIITGHDGFIKKDKPYSLDSYKYSRYYIDAVKQARKFDRNKDSLVIFAGACGSFYEALMKAGANFASSPKRVSINTFDPAIIAAEIAFTPIFSRVNLSEVIYKVKSSFNGIGGVDTRGTLRNGIPYNIDVD